jgi:hypothetical protein
MSPRKPRTPTPKPDVQPSSDAPSGTEPELKVEELEERIAPRLAANHNETVLAER